MIGRFVSLSLLIFLVASCVLNTESPIETSSDLVNLIQRGDIVVSNSGNDSIILLDSDGNYKDTLVSEQTSTTILFNGLAYDSINKEVLFNYDHTTAALDAVKAIDLYDGSVRTVISNSQLNGTLPGVARLTNGDLVILEGTNGAEKFDANGVRVGNPFLTGLTTNIADVTRLIDGGMVICSSGTANTVRIYAATGGAATATATSVSPGPTLGALASTSCTQGDDGTIYVAYSGGTDAVRAYSSNLSTVLWTFTDTNVLTTPGKLAVSASGTILVTDTAFHHIVEISSTGSLVRVIGGAALNVPNNIVVVR